MVKSYEAGTLAGVGSFRCEECGFAVALQQGDEVPSCPSCAATSFRRSSLFTAGGAVPAPQPEAAEPEWLSDARQALVRAGDYLAFEHDDRVRVVPLQEGWSRIGRSLAAHVRIDDPTVSRRHVLLFRDEHSAKALDDRSLNGVFHNGNRIEMADLADGDMLSVGRFTLHYVRLAGDRSPQRTASASSV